MKSNLVAFVHRLFRAMMLRVWWWKLVVKWRTLKWVIKKKRYLFKCVWCMYMWAIISSLLLLIRIEFDEFLQTVLDDLVIDYDIYRYEYNIVNQYFFFSFFELIIMCIISFTSCSLWLILCHLGELGKHIVSSENFGFFIID